MCIKCFKLKKILFFVNIVSEQLIDFKGNSVFLTYLSDNLFYLF